jgi:hydrogenase maturation protein HypF
MQRRAIDVRGIVQGVGFRPFVHDLASRHHLSGFVANQAGGVAIEVEGDAESLEQFQRELTASAPALARIESIGARPLPVIGERTFRIEQSRLGIDGPVVIAPDAATCQECVRELFDPHDRRYRYPFINCTDCGPRLTVVTGSPYDRERTTMASFAMCAACRAEYLDPANRRFHAEPIACQSCGPRLDAVDRAGASVGTDPIAAAASAIAGGRIVALKGLGGFHLACDAHDSAAVALLRRRKHRDDKPFALMVRDLDAARALCDLPAGAADLLLSPARPIVLLQKRTGASALVADAVAPDSDRLGIMLPYTPLHHLLMSALDGASLVLTSGNLADEPIATDNQGALSRLGGIADLFLLHDRPIHVRCDDSVVRQSDGGQVVVRRSRGYAPAPLHLPFVCPEPILAVGGQLKNTFALGRDRQAFLSHHIGDLDDLRALEAFNRDLALYQRLFGIAPRVVAHDLHRDYASTRAAMEYVDVTRIGVQHHHAHVASCITEHGLDGPVIGVAWDGAGWGTDDCVWGGEFLIGDCRRVKRAARFRYVAMPGGDRAAREPWRMALAHLRDAGIDDPSMLPDAVTSGERATVNRMIQRAFNSPLTSSVGRLFDAVAALCGMRPAITYEGQAAMWLETLAGQSASAGAYPFEIDEGALPAVIDSRQMVGAIAADKRAGVPAPVIARRFHATLAEIVAAMCRRLRDATGLSRVVLTGGVFLNAMLTADVEARVAAQGFGVYRHRLVPPGDGGLCLGQLAVAAASLRA